MVKQFFLFSWMLIVLVCVVSKANGDVIITVVENESGVVFSGSGSIDLDGLELSFNGDLQSRIHPNYFIAGPDVETPASIYDGVTGDIDLGEIVSAFASSGSGDIFGVDFLQNNIALPAGYTSGDNLSMNSTYDGQSLESLGIYKGSYTWQVGNNSTVTLNVVPEPSSITLTSIVGIFCIAIRRRSRQITK